MTTDEISINRSDRYAVRRFGRCENYMWEAAEIVSFNTGWPGVILRMKILNISLFFLLQLLIATVAIGQDEPARLAATWQVQKYDLSVTLPTITTERGMSVKAVISLKNVSARPASTLTLRLNQAVEVASVSVNGTNVDFTKGEEKINTAISLQRIMVRLPQVAAGGSISAAVDYKFTVKDNSGVGAISPVGSQFLPLSYWYPTPNSWYFPAGADRAPFDLRVSGTGNLELVSSGQQGASETGSAAAGASFREKFIGQPFFTSGNWDKIDVGGVSVFAPKGAGPDTRARSNDLAGLVADAKAFTAKLLGTASDAPIRIVSVRRGGGFAGGGTFFVDEGVFRRSKIDSQTAMSLADSVVKLWLGQAAAVNGDSYGVVSEGLTRYIATQFIESKYGKDVADVERNRQRIAYAAVAKRDSPLNIVSPLDDYYYPEVANKGAMIWRLVEKKAGNAAFYNAVRTAMQDGVVTASELRSAFPDQKELLDNMFEQVTDINLMAGLPQPTGAETKVALRNSGSLDVTVNVEAKLSSGETMAAPVSIKAKSFGEVAFRTPNKVTRVEIDPEKYYPQTEYSDDVAPREFTDSDAQLAVKRSFDKQEYAKTEAAALIVLGEQPRFDDVRILLARSLLALGRNADAEREFKAVLDEKLPTARSLAWANVGLAEIAAKANQNAQAVKYAEAAIAADAEYGASLAARAVRNRTGSPPPANEAVNSFFSQFDKAAAANKKADLESLSVPGEVSRFISGIAGQTTEWKTQVLHVDKIDDETMVVETSLGVKLLNREPESGTAVFRLTRIGNTWKLSSVDMFEVR